jgi:hypothetical protein
MRREGMIKLKSDYDARISDIWPVVGIELVVLTISVG